MRKIKTEHIVAALLLIVGLVLPLFMSAYKVNIFSSFFAGIILCFSLTFIWGYCGTFSFGQAAFYGLGGYLYGLITKNIGSPAATFPALLITIVIVGALAAFIGYFMFYGGVNDVFVGITTLCLTLVLSTFFGQTAGPQWKIGKVLLGGYNGMNGIPTLSLGGLKFTGLSFYYFCLAVMFIILIAFKIFEHTKWGYTLFAIRENRDRSRLFGYNVPKIQMIVFGVGGAIAALSGVLYACWGGYVSPNIMDMTSATIPVVLVAAGGRKSPTAAMLFGLIYYFVANMLAAAGSEYALMILGASLILVILFVPQGIFASLFAFTDSKFEQLFHKQKQ